MLFKPTALVLDLYHHKAIITELREQLEELRRDVVNCRELARRLALAATVLNGCGSSGE
jgi:hypothetical protein